MTTARWAPVGRAGVRAAPGDEGEPGGLPGAVGRVHVRSGGEVRSTGGRGALRMRTSPLGAGGALVDLLAVLGCGWLGLRRGQDMSWDLLSYHYEYPWTLFHQGLGSVDPEPFANRYLNPLAQLPWYGLERLLAPKPATFAIALLAGLNLLLIRRIAGLILPSRVQGWRRLALTSIAVALGASGTVFRTELGMSLADVIVSLPFLAGLLAVLTRGSSARRGDLLVVLGGVGSGVATAAKLTMAPFTIGLLAAVVVTAGLDRRWRRLPLHFAGIVAGVAAAGGWWYIAVWRTVGNPFFPYYNQVFRSPLFPSVSLRDARYGPRGLLDALHYPLYMAQGTSRLQEVYLRDPRWVVLCICVVAALFALAGRLLRRPAGTRSCRSASLDSLQAHRPHVALVVCFAVSSGVWLFQFGIARYAVTSELLVGPLLVGCLCVLLCRRVVVSFVAGLALCVAMLPWTDLGGYVHAPFARDRFGVQAAPLRAVPPGSIVVATSGPPSGFLLTYLPFGVERHQIHPYFYGSQLLRDLEHRMSVAPANYVLSGRPTKRQVAVLRRQVGLQEDVSSCQAVRSHSGTRWLCRAVWVGP